jgi:hypothetical protein
MDVKPSLSSEVDEEGKWFEATRGRGKVHNDIHYIWLGWQTKHYKDGQGI